MRIRALTVDGILVKPHERRHRPRYLVESRARAHTVRAQAGVFRALRRLRVQDAAAGRTEVTRRVDLSARILTGLVVVALVVAFATDPVLPVRGLLAPGKLGRSVWLGRLLGLPPAGLLAGLIPKPVRS